MKVCVTLPVYNEEEQLASSVEKVLKVCRENYKDFEILIADNASTDRTLDIAKELSKKYEEVKYIHLPQKGRGRALKAAWQSTDADIMCYMDIDLSTDLKHLKELTRAIEEGYDVAFGSRHRKESELKRCLKREILSRGYVFLVKLFLKTKYSDYQCGFKAVNKKIVRELLPKIKDNEWFFDTELIVKADKYGYRLKEIPVKWIEDKGSTVNIKKTVINYIKNIFRLRREFKGG